MDTQPIVVAAALIERRGRYLVARRAAGGPRGGLWEFPGGKVEAGETREAALARELREELGIDASVIRPTDTVRWAYADVTIELVAYECAFTAGEPVAGEHEELAWVTPPELLALPLCEADLVIARRLAAG